MASLSARKYFNTQYLCAHHALMIEELCESLDGKILDMTGVKATKDAIEKLSDMIKDYGVTVIDNEDPVRNDLFRQAKERRGLPVSTKLLPRLEKFEDFKSYIAALSKDEVYDLGHVNDERYYCPLVTLIQIYRPAIQIEVSMQYYSLATYACTYLYRRGASEMLREDKDFVLVLPNTTFDIHVPVNSVTEEFSLTGIGKVTFQDLVDKYYVIPKKLGMVQVLKSDEHEYWKKFSERVWEDLQRYFVNGKQTLESFLGI